MDITSLIIQLISGAVGGNAANSAKDTGLGPLGNTIAGALGGGVGGQILNAVLGLGGTAAASGLDIGTIVSAFADRRHLRRPHGARDRLSEVQARHLTPAPSAREPEASRANCACRLRQRAPSSAKHDHVKPPRCNPRQRDWYVTARMSTFRAGISAQAPSKNMEEIL